MHDWHHGFPAAPRLGSPTSSTTCSRGTPRTASASRTSSRILSSPRPHPRSIRRRQLRQPQRRQCRSEREWKVDGRKVACRRVLLSHRSCFTNSLMSQVPISYFRAWYRAPHRSRRRSERERMRLEWRRRTLHSSSSNQRSRTHPPPLPKLLRPALSWSHQASLGTAANTKPTRWHEKNRKWDGVIRLNHFQPYLRSQIELSDVLQGLGVSPLTARRIGARPGSLPGVSRAHSTEPIPVRFFSSFLKIPGMCCIQLQAHKLP